MKRVKATHTQLSEVTELRVALSIGRHVVKALHKTKNIDNTRTTQQIGRTDIEGMGRQAARSEPRVQDGFVKRMKVERETRGRAVVSYMAAAAANERFLEDDQSFALSIHNSVVLGTTLPTQAIDSPMLAKASISTAVMVIFSILESAISRNVKKREKLSIEGGGGWREEEVGGWRLKGGGG
ncbi:hypothetical protein K435DRAFT_813957 [Dendrothele bispora CBS 962.96]|uniref:Uncharacterized protein n=1 Tax=Dendrothele bispora (strain CBS 962.96) TaxID=1314807 RepID=A0A4S8KK62_DENBC|nr:hypothetical protein K435DRAFT_813957 [Dendrothele bispora CBS 962.96]